MDALAILFVGALVVIGLWGWLARAHSGPARRSRRARPRGGDPLGLRPARQIVEDREALEAEDLAQLLEATNARRRARGLPERSPDDAQREYGSGRPV